MVSLEVSVAWDIHPMVYPQPLGAEAKADSSSERGESGWRTSLEGSTVTSTHGQSEVLARYRRELEGIAAEPLETRSAAESD